MRFLDGQGHFVDVRIVGIEKYASFEKMLEIEGIRNCIPDAKTIEEGVLAYHSIPQYRNLGERLGVLAFRLQKI